MIWRITKSKHEWAILPLVRTWLRMGGGMRFMVLVGLSFMLFSLTFILQLTTVRDAWLMEEPQGGSWMDLGNVFLLLSWIFWLADIIVEKVTIKEDLDKLNRSPNMALATRGEYIGGHPKLPHGRFVYLTLSGILENPNLTILLPQEEGSRFKAFTMPVLDLQKTTQRKEKGGSELTLSGSLAFLTYRAKVLGERAVLNVEYIGQAGRKQRVEFTNFLTGNGEVQTWRNTIVCIQAEADTGEKPYGPWKSLPRRTQRAKGA